MNIYKKDGNILSSNDFKQQYKNCMGIYMIKNITNCKIYIGKSTNIYNRYKSYEWSLRGGKCHNFKLQEDYNEFGSESFIFKILETCDYDSLDILESEYVKKYNSFYEGYNIQKLLDYNILKEKEFVKKIQVRLLKGLSPRLDSERFLLNDIAEMLKISINDLKVIIRNIKYNMFKKYDTELRIENEYTNEYLRKISISEKNKVIARVHEFVCL